MRPPSPRSEMVDYGGGGEQATLLIKSRSQVVPYLRLTLSTTSGKREATPEIKS